MDTLPCCLIDTQPALSVAAIPQLIREFLISGHCFCRQIDWHILLPDSGGPLMKSVLLAVLSVAVFILSVHAMSSQCNRIRTVQMSTPLEAVIDDPGAYPHSWTVAWNLKWWPDSQLDEYVCEENNRYTRPLKDNFGLPIFFKNK
jgi:hypothetical protein